MKFSAHLGYLFADRPLAERFAAARAAGFAAVEHPGPYELAPERLRALLDENALTFVQFALKPGDESRGEKGYAIVPGREAEFRRSVEEGLDYAIAAGAPFIQVHSGVTPHTIDFDTLWRTYVANLVVAADLAAARSLGVLIEPIGPGTLANYFMNHSDLGLRALKEVGRPNLRLLFDVFHSTAAGVDPIAFIRAHVDVIGHIHIADHPGRHQPGTGAIDFPALFATIETAGFRGFIGCEYKPEPTTEASLDWYAPYRAQP